MKTVRSVELQKNFGRLRDMALAEPVVVTHYDRPSLVIMSVTEYERMKRFDKRARRLDELSDEEIDEMAAAEIPSRHRYSLADVPEGD